jgi:hypothetical protein
VHTPLFCGAPFKAGVLVFFLIRLRPFLTNWLMVGISSSFSIELNGAHSAYAKAFLYIGTCLLSSIILVEP